MSLYSKFLMSEDAEQKGIELDYGEGTIIRVARAGGSNKRYQKALERVSRKYKRQLQLDILSTAESNAIMKEVFAETVVLSWEGVTDLEGKAIPFSKAACLKLFDDLPDLFNDVQEQASNQAIFREDIREADAGN